MLLHSRAGVQALLTFLVDIMASPPQQEDDVPALCILVKKKEEKQTCMQAK